MIGVVYMALIAPQLVLSLRGQRRRWAQVLFGLGTCLLAYGFWRELGGVEALSNPYVYVGLVLGATLPFAFAWVEHRAKRSAESSHVASPLSDDE
jgi:uncharacterized membrane protein